MNASTHSPVIGYLVAEIVNVSGQNTFFHASGRMVSFDAAEIYPLDEALSLLESVECEHESIKCALVTVFDEEEPPLVVSHRNGPDENLSSAAQLLPQKMEALIAPTIDKTL